MSLCKKFFKFAIPSVISMWVFSFYSMVDGMFVAWGVGENALAAVNLSTPLTCLIFSIGLLFSVGTSTVISIALGKGDEKEACNIFNQNLFVLSIVALTFSAFILLNLEKVALFLGATEHTLTHVKEYVGVIAPFAVFFMVSYNLEVLVKADGSPHISAIGVISCALMNVLLDYVFVMHFGWGVMGAALATGLAQVTSTTIFIVYFVVKKTHLNFGKFRFKLSIYRRILPIGLPDGITELSGGLVVFMFNQTILAVIGEQGIVSYTVISYVNTLVLMTMSGISQGIQPLCSFYYGREDRKSYHTLLRYGLTAVAVMSLTAFAIGQFGSSIITSMFLAKESEMFSYTVWALRLFSCSFLVLGFNVIFAGFFTAIERPRYSLTISMGRGIVLLAASLLFMALFVGETGVWLASFFSESACLLITLAFVFRYRKSLPKIRQSERTPLGAKTAECAE